MAAELQHAPAVLYAASQVLPYGKAMCLIDEIIESTVEHIVARVTIRPDSRFCEMAKGVPAWVGIEYMAQTVAAYSGIEEVRENRKPSIGLLLGSRSYESQVSHFPVDAQLEIVARLLLRDAENLVAFDCEIFQDARRIARADIKAYRPTNIQDVLTAGRNG